MNIETLANWIVRALPVDREAPERALRFFQLVRTSGSCLEARELVLFLYRLAGTGDWEIDSLADMNMLIYALRENPGLIEDVSEDVEKVLARYGIRGNVFPAWTYVRRRAAKAA